MRRVLGSNGGFTYLAVLAMVVITGIMASQGALVWKTAMQREREAELIYRGTQIRDAMRRWYKFRIVDGKKVEPFPAQAPRSPNLPELQALLKDPNSQSIKRYLRPSALIDPMSPEEDGEWDVVKDTAGKIIGVKSKSMMAPLKQGNFPFDLHPGDFEKKKNYTEWQFIYDRIPPVDGTGGAITGLDGMKSTTGSNPPSNHP